MTSAVTLPYGIDRFLMEVGKLTGFCTMDGAAALGASSIWRWCWADVLSSASRSCFSGLKKSSLIQIDNLIS